MCALTDKRDVMHRLVVATAEASNVKSKSTSWICASSESASCFRRVEPTAPCNDSLNASGKVTYLRSQGSEAAWESEKCNQRNSPGRSGPSAVKNSTAACEVICRAGSLGTK